MGEAGVDARDTGHHPPLVVHAEGVAVTVSEPAQHAVSVGHTGREGHDVPQRRDLGGVGWVWAERAPPNLLHRDRSGDAGQVHHTAHGRAVPPLAEEVSRAHETAGHPLRQQTRGQGHPFAGLPARGVELMVTVHWGPGQVGQASCKAGPEIVVDPEHAPGHQDGVEGVGAGIGDQPPEHLARGQPISLDVAVAHHQRPEMVSPCSVLRRQQIEGAPDAGAAAGEPPPGDVVLEHRAPSAQPEACRPESAGEAGIVGSRRPQGHGPVVQGRGRQQLRVGG